MITEIWDGYKVYPFNNISDVHKDMELFGESDYSIIETSIGFIAKVIDGRSTKIYDNYGSFHYNQ